VFQSFCLPRVVVSGWSYWQIPERRVWAWIGLLISAWRVSASEIMWRYKVIWIPLFCMPRPNVFAKRLAVFWLPTEKVPAIFSILATASHPRSIRSMLEHLFALYMTYQALFI